MIAAPERPETDGVATIPSQRTDAEWLVEIQAAIDAMHARRAAPPLPYTYAQQRRATRQALEVLSHWGITLVEETKVNPRRAWITAKVSSSASVSFGVMPIVGRRGARSGAALSRSSILT